MTDSDTHMCATCSRATTDVLYMPFYYVGGALGVHKVCLCCKEAFLENDIELDLYETEKEALQHKG